ncbi:hypothetical protein, partial [Treponema saccharophilum]|uniref:hypothetical protein n=1 Tax=Treponema saccharophilum TaxID=165 RepID=UPI003866292D
MTIPSPPHDYIANQLKTCHPETGFLREQAFHHHGVVKRSSTGIRAEKAMIKPFRKHQFQKRSNVSISESCMTAKPKPPEKN